MGRGRLHFHLNKGTFLSISSPTSVLSLALAGACRWGVRGSPRVGGPRARRAGAVGQEWGQPQSWEGSDPPPHQLSAGRGLLGGPLLPVPCSLLPISITKQLPCPCSQLSPQGPHSGWGQGPSSPPACGVSGWLLRVLPPWPWRRAGGGEATLACCASTALPLLLRWGGGAGPWIGVGSRPPAVPSRAAPTASPPRCLARGQSHPLGLGLVLPGWG